MFRTVKIIVSLIFFVFLISCQGRDVLEWEGDTFSNSSGIPESGGTSRFKIPLAGGYAWEITQSWAEHCNECNNRGYDNVYGNYCVNSSHLGSCCKHSWDFNLGGDADLGRPAIASGEGTVKYVGVAGDWGQTIVINHGDNICTRYAHLSYGSTNHLKVGDYVCQGLKIGEINGTPRWSPHLHFQFEECDTEDTIAMGFDDGNGIPICTIGNDVYDSQGRYDLLVFTNKMVESCEGSETHQSLVDVTNTGESCGALTNCPLNKSCNRAGSVTFADKGAMDSQTFEAATYLWKECSIDGKEDGKFHAEELVTRAEVVKVALITFGLLDQCPLDITEPYNDVYRGDWYQHLLACGIFHGLISPHQDNFFPNNVISYIEATKIIVLGALKAKLISSLYEGSTNHFELMNKLHWGWQYLETLREKGNFTRNLSTFVDAADLTRGEFAIMTSGFSPCFCKNVSCDNNCFCSQENFACMSSSADQNGQGGDENAPGWHTATDDNSSDSNDENSNQAPEENNPSQETEYVLEDEEEVFEEPSLDDIFSGRMMDVDCRVSNTQTQCSENGMGILTLKCSMENIGLVDLYIDHIYLNLLRQQDRDNCNVTDDTLLTDSQHLTISPGEQFEFPGEMEIRCLNSLPVPQLQFSYTLAEDHNGAFPIFDDMHQEYVSFDPDLLNCIGQEDAETVMIDGWECDYGKVYQLNIEKEGIHYRLNSQTQTDSYLSVTQDDEVTFNFSCSDLPAAVLVGGIGNRRNWIRINQGEIDNYSLYYPVQTDRIPEIYPDHPSTFNMVSDFIFYPTTFYTIRIPELN